ncbi:hypothetical protein GCM10009021_02530 [Halarchaeum nitratireducens]|uniref:Uncharacterized protein n=1 Tax=Halarchaeum nitratireducens TaxID=489913 RepID=A0A830G7U2_9EURY|nr:hypothetical protein GCM10009021_02530 [Halarchaeum nitratireducens]
MEVARHEGDEPEERRRVVAADRPRAGDDDRRTARGVQGRVPREPTGGRRAGTGERVAAASETTRSATGTQRGRGGSGPTRQVTSGRPKRIAQKTPIPTAIVARTSSV